MRLSGTITALVTPFKSDEVDLEGLRENLSFQIEHGVDGILVAGTTGESATLTIEEQERIIQIAVDEVRGKIPVIVGTGTNATRTTIQRTERAKELGADAALIVTPYYNRPTQEGLYQHFSAISEKADFPYYIYNIPKRTGVHLHTETLVRMVNLPHLYGVKEAPADLAQFQEVIQKISLLNERFSILCGDDILTYPMQALGSSGVIAVASNLIPREMKSLTSASSLEEARKIHNRLLPLFQALSLETNPIPIKTAMSLWGMPAGLCRPPLGSMNPKHQEQLQKLLKSWMKTEIVHVKTKHPSC